MAEAYPITTVNAAHPLRKVEDIAYPPVEEGELSFLYIGGSETLAQCFSAYFRTGIKADNFNVAKSLIQTEKNLDPDAIFFDQTLNERELQDFCAFLKEKKLYSKAILIYNDQKLDPAKVKFLKQNQLVDDVMNINSQHIDYSSKIQFLKRIKNRQNGFIISREIEAANKKIDLRIGSILKRQFDIVLASLLILMFLPIFILVAIAIKLESRGSVIYASPRAGRGYKIFKFYKFRTMETGADAKIQNLAHLNQYKSEGKAAFLKIANDPRVTKVGKVLRKCSLDEMPQLFNVLKGDMSLVGNRPLPLYEASALTTNESVERFMAPAGMTGLWQIKKRGKEEMSAEERINLDIMYARKHSIVYDFWIIANTPGALLQKSDV
jgi:lipopolysaccharide/colanic/teichoic acid biosynthesis glycosyltransferase